MSARNPKNLAGYHGTPCAYCNVLMMVSRPHKQPRRRHEATRDHAMVPKAIGGKLTKANRVICCHACNSEKGNLPLAEWHMQLVLDNDPRAELVEIVLAELETYARISEDKGNGSSASVPAVSREAQNGEAEHDSAT